MLGSSVCNVCNTLLLADDELLISVGQCIRCEIAHISACAAERGTMRGVSSNCAALAASLLAAILDARPAAGAAPFATPVRSHAERLSSVFGAT